MNIPDQTTFPDTVQHWFEQWRLSAQETSVEYVQELYSRLLVGQVKNPGALSLRTLDIVRSLDEDMAALFFRLRRYALTGFGFPVWGDREWQSRGTTWAAVQDLATLGLLLPSPATLTLEPGGEQLINHHGRLIRVAADRSAKQLRVQALTRAGHELFNIFEPDDSAWAEIATWIHNESFGFEIGTTDEAGRVTFVPWIPEDAKSDDDS